MGRAAVVILIPHDDQRGDPADLVMVDGGVLRWTTITTKNCRRRRRACVVRSFVPLFSRVRLSPVVPDALHGAQFLREALVEASDFVPHNAKREEVDDLESAVRRGAGAVGATAPGRGQKRGGRGGTDTRATHTGGWVGGPGVGAQEKG